VFGRVDGLRLNRGGMHAGINGKHWAKVKVRACILPLIFGNRRREGECS
jgi:hypothetical protein